MQALQLQARAAIAVALAIASLPADGRGDTSRSSAVTAAFQRAYPCPSTGQRSGPCPGWIKDHAVPLCAKGPDTVLNLQWQTVADARAKDRDE